MRQDSDTDLAIWTLRPAAMEELLEWHRELARFVDTDVQLVLATPDLDPVLGMQIAREGKALFESRSGDWIEARVRLWQAYQDALPFLRAAREELRAFVGEVRDGS